MVFHRIKQGMALFIGLICASSCGAPETEGNAAEGSEAPAELELGQLRLALVTDDENRFRLSEAVFQIETVSGTRVVTLDSDTNPEAEQLQAELSDTQAHAGRLQAPAVQAVVDLHQHRAVGAHLQHQRPGRGGDGEDDAGQSGLDREGRRGGAGIAR